MPSSTSHRASFNPGLLWMLWIGIAGSLLVWLMAEQTGYTLAYQTCDAHSTSWVIVPTAGALIVVIGIVAMSVRSHRRAEHDHEPLPFLGRLALPLSVMAALILVASLIAPLMLHACD